MRHATPSTFAKRPQARANTVKFIPTDGCADCPLRAGDWSCRHPDSEVLLGKPDALLDHGADPPEGCALRAHDLQIGVRLKVKD